MQIYKKGQGRYTRAITWAAAFGLAVISAVNLTRFLDGYRLPLIVQFGVPVLLVIGVALLVFWLVNRPNTADFLIATEGEMKKVSWSSRKEVIGSTKVVIITTLVLALILFGVDLMFIFLFDVMGVSG
jgi:preprotein translocase subunit SecE